jgi:hypothetical protein
VPALPAVRWWRVRAKAVFGQPPSGYAGPRMLLRRSLRVPKVTITPGRKVALILPPRASCRVPLRRWSTPCSSTHTIPGMENRSTTSRTKLSVPRVSQGLLALLMLLTSLAAAGCDRSNPSGCAKDIDCKGDRVCVKEACIDPPASPLHEPRAIEPLAQSASVPPAAPSGSDTGAYARPHREGSIAWIRDKYAEINRSSKGYRLITKTVSGVSTEGGQLVAFLDGPAVQKINFTAFGETGRTLAEYYFWDGQLIFAFIVDERYDSIFGKVDRKRENRHYFFNRRMIMWLNEERREVVPASPEYAAAAKQVLKNADSCVRWARDPRAEISVE